MIMSIIKDAKKVQDMMYRVYNGKMIERNDEKNIMGDEQAIKELCNATFGDGSVNPDPTTLHQFNNIVVKVADKVAEPDLQKMLQYFANVQNVPADTQLVEYKKEHPSHLKFKWTAVGSMPALKRVEVGERDFIRISNVQTAVSYNPLTQNDNCVENFKALVDDIASAKVRLMYETVINLIQTAVTGSTGKIPTQQIVTGSNITPVDFNKVANIIARRTGSRPIFVADRVLIDALATQIGETASTLLTDSIKDDMYNFELTNLRTADAVPMVNEFTTLDGFATQFPVNRGYILGGAGYSKKPFEIALAGGLVQNTENEFVHGRVKMVVRQALGIDLLSGECIGYVEDDAITDVF